MNFKDFASKEEYFFSGWLVEAEKAKLVKGIHYQPNSFCLSEREVVIYTKQLKTKTKKMEKFLFRPHIYTPDFYFQAAGKLIKYFVNPCYFESKGVYVDVKGIFNKYGDQKQFSINQKWVYQKFGIYIEKVVPEKLFKKTWCPEVARYSLVQKKPVAKYVNCRNINEFLKRDI